MPASIKCLTSFGFADDNGSYPEQVFFNNTDLAVVIPNSIVNRYLFNTTALWKSYQKFITLIFRSPERIPGNNYMKNINADRPGGIDTS